MYAPNKLTFLAYHLIRELEILHDGNLYDNLMLYVRHAQTFTEATSHQDTLDPFNIPTSQIMTSYLNRFYACMRKDAFFVELTARTKYIISNTSHIQLNAAVTSYILSFLDYTPSPSHAQEVAIARAYHERCSTPALRYYIHTLPLIHTVMDLMAIYATDTQMNPDQQRRNRHTLDHSQVILSRTFSRLVEASTRYYDANILRQINFKYRYMILTKKL